MRHPLIAALGLLCAAVPAAAQEHGADGGEAPPAADRTLIVIRTAEVSPRRLYALPGETVVWRNVSLRTHTVTSRDGLFDVSLGSTRATSHAFPGAGDFGYYCRIHPNVTGAVAVRAVLVAGPAGSVVRGEQVSLNGRTAPGAGEAVIARDGTDVARVPVAADGTFSARVPAEGAGVYTAAVGVERSDPVAVSLVDRRTVSAYRAGRRIHVQVTPAQKGTTVVLQLRLKERFGWWPTATARTDAAGRATLRVPRRHAPARIALVAGDGATVLARAPIRGR